MINVAVVLVDGWGLVLWLTNHRSHRWRVDVGKNAAGDSLRKQNITSTNPMI